MSLNIDQLSLDDGWNTLKRNHIARIESHANSIDIRAPPRPIFTPSEFIAGYSTVYSLCTGEKNSNEEPIYLRLCQCFTEYLRCKVNTKEEAAVTPEAVVETWIRYGVYVAGITGIFSYLDRFYVRRTAKPGLRSKALEIFQVMIFEKHKHGLKSALLRQLDARRSTMEADEIMIEAITKMYLELDATGGNQYREELESDIIKRAAKYFSSMAPIWAKDLELVDYVSIVEHCMEQEAEDSRKWLVQSTHESLMQTISETMLVEQVDVIIAKMHEMDALFQSWNETDLQLIYRVLRNLELCVSSIADTLKRYIQRSNKGSPFDQILDCWIGYQGLLRRCFSDDAMDNVHAVTATGQGASPTTEQTKGVNETWNVNPLISNSVREAFRIVVTGNVPFVKHLVNHWNSIILKGAEDFTHELQTACKLLELLDCRSLFFQCYKLKLASRLLYGESSVNLERRSLSMLETISSTDDTASLRRMVKQIAEHRKLKHERRICLISKADWPLMKDYKEGIKIHEDFERAFRKFDKSQEPHIHRKVEYNRMLGRVELELISEETPKKIFCDIIQASILLLFRGYPLTLNYISETLNLNNVALMPILQPLVDRSIIKITDGQSVELNPEFMDGVDVTLKVVPEVEQEQQSNSSEQVLETSTRLDASIMSILKRVKALGREELVLHLSKFPREAIVNRIDSLRQREYLSVDGGRICYTP